MLPRIAVIITDATTYLEIGVNLDSDRLKTITQAVSEHDFLLSKHMSISYNTAADWPESII